MHGMVQRMQDAASAQEEQRFEERVRKQVKHTRARSILSARYTQADKHIAKLADGGESQHTLEVILHQGYRCGKERGDGANPGDHLEGQWVRRSKKREGTCDHVYTGSDHRCRV